MSDTDDILGRPPMQKVKTYQADEMPPFAVIAASFDMTSRSIPNYRNELLSQDKEIIKARKMSRIYKAKERCEQ